MLWWLILAVGVALAAYVRLAPSDPARWHVKPQVSAPKDFEGGALRKVRGGVETLEKIDEIARTEPRTEVLAGSASEGMITYVARSKLWGFPDYITIWQDDAEVLLYSRLRFGRSDMGVNRARLERWIDQL